ncbi:MAG: cell envelope integrity protein TolA [Desulfamplus sp.]|nr:cell envelope integrity protein TolA [Desulfamplus sp.]
MSSLDFLQSITTSSSPKYAEANTSMTMMYGLSVALHLLLFLIVMFSQSLNPVPIVPFAVQVDLVSFSPGPPDGSSSLSSEKSIEQSEESASSPSPAKKSESAIKQPEAGTKEQSKVEVKSEKESDAPVKSLQKKSIKPENEVKVESEAPVEQPKVEPKPEPKPKPEPEVKTKSEPKPEPEIVEKAEIHEPVVAKPKESLKKRSYDSEKVEKANKEAVATKETSKTDSPPTKEVASNSGSEKGDTAKEANSPPSKEKASGSNNTSKSGGVTEGDGEGDLTAALSRMKSKVESQSAAAKKGSGGGSGSGVSRGSGGAISSGGQGSGTTSEAIGLYNLELMYKIRQNWSFNEKLAGADGKQEVRILIKILQNGEIRDIWFETRSGNDHLDESALKAVKKSNPLSPLPSGYTSYDIGLIFTPSGLK